MAFRPYRPCFLYWACRCAADRGNYTAAMNTSDSVPSTSAWEEARRQGVDMDLLEESLRMTPDERFAAHRQALRLAPALAPEENEH